MSRADYQAERRQARASIEPREDRGLPQHPAADGFATCIDCDGRGEFMVGQSNDPQTGECENCRTCDGFGVVPDGRGPDPLVVMRQDRKWIRYGSIRRRYMQARAAMRGAA